MEIAEFLNRDDINIHYHADVTIQRADLNVQTLKVGIIVNFWHAWSLMG